MRAVIVEIEDKTAIVLDCKGGFRKIKNTHGLYVGYEVDIPSTKGFTVNTVAKFASLAAVFILAAGLGYGAYSYSQPYSYVDVDINPSIELTVNRYDRIINASGINGDGKKVLEKGKYLNKSIEDGIKSILKAATETGYLKNNIENGVLITISSKADEKASQIKEKVQGAASGQLKADNTNTNVVLENMEPEKREEEKVISDKLGISPGKLALIQKAIELEPAKKVDDLKDQPVREIMKDINEHKKENKTKNTDDKKSAQNQIKSDDTKATKDTNDQGKVKNQKTGKDDIKSNTIDKGKDLKVDSASSDKKAKEDKAKADKAKADKAKIDKAKIDKAKEEKAKMDKAKEDKAKVDKAKADKAKVDKAKTDKTKVIDNRDKKDVDEKAGKNRKDTGNKNTKENNGKR
jgi:hypothetical protein